MLIPSDAENYGFELDEDVILTLHPNKIEITLEEKKETYYSRISRYTIKDGALIPIWNNSNKSTRFEELDHLCQRGNGGWDMKLYYDHQEDRYIIFVCRNDQGATWFGHYLTEEQYKLLKNEKISPWDIGY
ncbi:MAG: hypothetical protein ACOC1X_00375 [Promethearchaeota archaeon]